MINVGLEYGGGQYKTLPAGTVSTVGIKPITVPILSTGYTEVMFTGFCRDMWLQVDTTNLAPEDSVVVVAEGSLDDAGYDTLTMATADGTAASVTITTNTTTLLYFRDTLLDGLANATKRTASNKPGGTEFIFNKGTVISAQSKSESGSNTATIWLEIQEI